MSNVDLFRNLPVQLRVTANSVEDIYVALFFENHTNVTRNIKTAATSVFAIEVMCVK